MHLPVTTTFCPSDTYYISKDTDAIVLNNISHIEYIEGQTFCSTLNHLTKVFL